MTTGSGDNGPASQLWSARDPAKGTRTRASATYTASSGSGTAAGSSDSPPRDVDSMKAEIAELQSETTASLDRAIAAAQAATNVGNNVCTELEEQREQMGQIEADARGIDADLKRTGYHIKYGFTWRGALTSPFRKASKKPQGAPAAGVRDVSPVFKDGYQNSGSSSPGPAHGGGATDTKAKGGLFGSSASRKNGGKKKGSEAGGGDRALPPMVPQHVPEGFEKQLDDLDGLLDGLSVQAKAIGAELKQQNEGIEVLGAKVEPVLAETATQSRQIKRRFRVKG